MFLSYFIEKGSINMTFSMIIVFKPKWTLQTKYMLQSIIKRIKFT